MALPISRRALEKWAERDLTVDRQPDGSLLCRFAYEGTSCRNGGQPYGSTIHAMLKPEGDGAWRIAEVSVEIDPDDPGWKATCIHESSREPDISKLTVHPPARGMLLDEFLARDWPVDNAGCYCTSIHVTHKLLLAFSTVRYWLTRHTTAPDVQTS